MATSTVQPRLSKQDKIWRAQDDAQTLSRAEDILKDASRLKLAKKQAQTMVRDQEKSLTSMKKVANSKKTVATKKK